MSDEPPRDDAVGRQKARDAGLVLPLAGAVLLTPPVATAIARDAPLFGVPVPVLHVFGVWAGLILAAWLLSRRLVADQPAPRRSEVRTRQR